MNDLPEIKPNGEQVIAFGMLVAKWRKVKVLYQEEGTDFIFVGCGDPVTYQGATREFSIYIMVLTDGSTHS